ncbi:hypothetical protein ABW19_dt0200337 [Dactylella cylindrospora]|nr:hypothetical protein ABW19_dt0200337 [Dactylella cylindrospora]
MKKFQLCLLLETVALAVPSFCWRMEFNTVAGLPERFDANRNYLPIVQGDYQPVLARGSCVTIDYSGQPKDAAINAFDFKQYFLQSKVWPFFPAIDAKALLSVASIAYLPQLPLERSGRTGLLKEQYGQR